jgi:hypothetical protein
LQPIRVWELLRRFESGPMLATYLGATAAIAALYRTHRMSAKMLYIVLPLVSFGILVTFTVKSIDPLIPAMPFRARYLDVGVPMAVISVGLACSFGLEWLRARAKTQQGARSVWWAAYFVLAAVLAYEGAQVTRDSHRDPHPFVQVDEQDRIVDAGVDAGMPLVARDEKKGHKILFVAATIYVDDARLAAAHRDVPPKVGTTERYKYLHGLAATSLTVEGAELSVVDPTFGGSVQAALEDPDTEILWATGVRPVRLRLHRTSDLHRLVGD